MRYFQWPSSLVSHGPAHSKMVYIIHQECINFPNSISHLKSLGPRKVTWSKFQNKEPQILGVTANLIATAGVSQDLSTPAIRKTHSIQFFYHLSVTTVPASVLKESRDVLSSYFAVTIHNKRVIKHACLINDAKAYNPKFRYINMLAFRNRHTGFLISKIRKIKWLVHNV